jgi:hypothetical protein
MGKKLWLVTFLQEFLTALKLLTGQDFFSLPIFRKWLIAALT